MTESLPSPGCEPTLIRLARVPREYAFYRWGNVAINVWTAAPSEGSVASLAELTAQSTRTCPHGISSVHWLTSDAGLPTRAARMGLREISVRYSNHIACVAAVLDGSGFWASALRAALNGIVIAAEVRFVPRLYGSVDTLVDWLPEAHLRGTGTRVRANALRDRILEAVRETTAGATR